MSVIYPGCLLDELRSTGRYTRLESWQKNQQAGGQQNWRPR